MDKKATVQHTVTFESDGGELSYSSVDIDDGSSIGELPTATKTGFYFDGWYTQSGVKVDGTETINSDKTYYAHWKKIYIVTFLTYGGDLSIVSNVIEVIDGDKIPELPTAIKPNNIFDGWYTSNSYNENEKFTGSTPVTSNIILYAKFTEISNDDISEDTIYSFSGASQVSGDYIFTGSAVEGADPLVSVVVIPLESPDTVPYHWLPVEISFLFVTTL